MTTTKKGAGESEARFKDRVMVKFGHGDMRLFNNPVGSAFVGKSVRAKRGWKLVTDDGKVINLNPGDVVIQQARQVTYGLAVGSSDLIGIRRTLVTPSMVGEHVGVFVGAETKTPRGRVKEEQRNFAEMIRGLGGEAHIIHDMDEADIALGTRLLPL